MTPVVTPDFLSYCYASLESAEMVISHLYFVSEVV